jgi:hypothetical protein
VKKAVWTLNLGNNYAPEVTEITYPLMKHYAHKIGAEFNVITERQFPEWPITLEKLQIYKLGRSYEWNIFADSDALIHPEMFDPTNHLKKDTVAHNGSDMAGNRWRYDQYFLRDGRHIGSCNWFAIASEWCLDLWHPPDDQTPEEALANIFPTVEELAPITFAKDQQGNRILDSQKKFIMREKEVITPEHLIDDYLLSRNIARFGLKFMTVMDIQKDRQDRGFYMWHCYSEQVPEKVRQMREVLALWGLDRFQMRVATAG